MRQFLTGILLLMPAAAGLMLSTPPTQGAICDGISTASETPLVSVRFATNLTKPCFLTAPAGDTHRVFILEQDGRVRIVKDGTLLSTPFLDLGSITRSPSDGGNDEQGLLGLAFSPTYASDGLFFVFHTDNAGTANLIARYRVGANPDGADTSTRTLILTLAHPSFGNHNGGAIMFGPGDGYLYIGTGDGGDGCDPGGGGGNAQNTNDLRGKMLRIDVIPPPASPATYRIPADNPGYPKPEVFSIGLRNPWRYSFDRQTHDVYIADVGQNTWEEINYRTGANKGNGANYGWQNYEGVVCPAPGCDGLCTSLASRVDPAKVYSHSSGCSITGGYVYRGCRMPGLAAQGRYFYADYCTAKLESFVISGGAVTNEVTYTSQLSPAIGGSTINLVTSWGEDARGELYIIDRGSDVGTGEVFKIVPALRSFEVSGSSAAGSARPAELRLGDIDWRWEDLVASSDFPIDSYRVYRHIGNGNGTFQCVYKTPTVTPPARPSNIWTGGDLANPAVGSVYSYVVTGYRGGTTPQESSPGRASNGTLRTLGTSACP